MPAVMRGQSPGKPAARSRKAPAGKGAPAPRKTRPSQAGAQLVGAGQFSGLSQKVAAGAALSVFSLAIVITLATGGRGKALADMAARSAANAYGDATSAMGFSVRQVRVAGASSMAEADIRKAADVEQGAPLLTLDLDHIRTAVEHVGWVKSAHVIRMLPGVLMISVTERPRLAVWQHSGQLAVIDADGQPIPEADASQFPNLPLVVGEGASSQAGSILALVQARPRLSALVDAVIRVDGRRWDLRLRDGSLIQLPAEGEDAALIALDRLDRDQRVLELGFSRIDLRTGDPMVRPKGAPQIEAAAAAPTGR